ncbi:hydrolase [Novosphingobium sediminis]|uniref:Hydrolase n=1 Tax=Novosphingobium sediminis TaxID=707214 RepID=A0A512AP90_9SPHN|nr:alpha/beta hydrolase [Novosphingobium sediminis]GEO01511.1 hydrolase [Novosphingobium sediminis]
MSFKSRLVTAAVSASVLAVNVIASFPALAQTAPMPAAAQIITTSVSPDQVRFGTMKIDGLNIAYREAGDPSLPKLVLLHGWPSSSHQYRNMLPALSKRFHVIAPDYQGFGDSERPDPATYQYSFDAISVTMEKLLAAKGFDHYGLFVQDYGGPVGFRIVGRNPKALDWLVVQNSNAYEEGFSAAWDGFRKALWLDRSAKTEAPLVAFNTLDAIKNVVYLNGAGHPELVSPDSYEYDAANVAGPTNLRIQLDLFYDYRHNPELYPVWQKFLRDNQPKTLIFWGQQDVFFTPAGGEAFLRDLPKAELHRLKAGHFATEDNLPYIADHIISFYDKQVKSKR